MKLRFLITAVFVIFLTIGCGEPYLRTDAGNSNIRRGRYQEALSDYLEGMKKTGNELILQYNIGNVYYYLGETQKAVTIWEQSANASSKEAVYRSVFNQGVVHYQNGEYSRASDCFLLAVKAEPDRIKAKINLELCIKKITEQSEISSEGLGIEESQELSEKIAEENSLLLRLIREGEVFILNQEESASTEQNGNRIQDW